MTNAISKNGGGAGTGPLAEVMEGVSEEQTKLTFQVHH